MKSLPTRCPGGWEKTKGSWFNSGAARHNIKCKSWKNNNCWRRNKYVYAISVLDLSTFKSYQSRTNNSLNNTYFKKKQVTCMTPTKAPAAFMLYNIPTLESMRNFLPKAIGLGMPACHTKFMFQIRFLSLCYVYV